MQDVYYLPFDQAFERRMKGEVFEEEFEAMLDQYIESHMES